MAILPDNFSDLSREAQMEYHIREVLRDMYQTDAYRCPYCGCSSDDGFDSIEHPEWCSVGALIQLVAFKSSDV